MPIVHILYIAAYNCRTLMFLIRSYTLYIFYNVQAIFIVFLGAQLVVVGVVPPPCVAR